MINLKSELQAAGRGKHVNVDAVNGNYCGSIVEVMGDVLVLEDSTTTKRYIDIKKIVSFRLDEHRK